MKLKPGRARNNLMTAMTKTLTTSVLTLMLVGHMPPLFAQDAETGPVGPSPYTVVSGWHQPFAAEGYAFGGNSGVFAESLARIFIGQRGETRLPNPVPPEFAGHVGSIGINALRDTDRRTWQNCLFTVDGDGQVIDIWDQWDRLCEGSDGPGTAQIHQIRFRW